MPISFSLILDPLHVRFCQRQQVVLEILMTCNKLDQYADPTGGLVYKMAKEGIRSTPKGSVSEKNLLCVVDTGFFKLKEKGSGIYGLFIEFLLNGQYYKLITDWDPKNGMWGYTATSIKAIRQPSALDKVIGKEVPAPINTVTAVPSTVTPEPGETVVDNNYHLTVEPADEYIQV